jgi:hypothetical protein
MREDGVDLGLMSGLFLLKKREIRFFSYLKLSRMSCDVLARGKRSGR